MLARRHFIVLGLCGHGKLPQLVVKLLHKGIHRGTDGAKVMLLQLLALGGGGAKESPARKNQVGPRLVILFLNEEVLLLWSDSRYHSLGLATKQTKHALCLLLQRSL